MVKLMLDRDEYLVRADGHQTIVMGTGANLFVPFHGETWATGKLMPDDRVPRTERGGPRKIGGTVDRYDWRPHRAGYVHQAAVVTDQHVARFDQRGRLLDRSLPRCQKHPRSQSLGHLLDHRCFRARAKE